MLRLFWRELFELVMAMSLKKKKSSWAFVAGVLGHKKAAVAARLGDVETNIDRSLGPAPNRLKSLV